MKATPQEQVLTVSSAGNDVTSQKLLAEITAPWLYALAFRLTQNPPLAREATIEALARSIKALKPMGGTLPFRALAAENLIHYLRDHSKEMSKPIPLSYEEELNVSADIPRERRALLGMMIAGIKRLPFEDRVILLLRDQGHLSCEVIGKIVGMKTDQTIRKMLGSIRAHLRKAMIAPLNPGKS